MILEKRPPFSIFILFALMASGLACSPPAEKRAFTESLPVPLEKQPEKPAETKPTPEIKSFKPLTPACEQLLLQIRALDKGIPLVFHDLKRPVDQINADL